MTSGEGRGEPERGLDCKREREADKPVGQGAAWGVRLGVTSASPKVTNEWLWLLSLSRIREVKFTWHQDAELIVSGHSADQPQHGHDAGRGDAGDAGGRIEFPLIEPRQVSESVTTLQT